MFNIDQVPYPSKPGAKPPTWSNTHQVYRDTVSHRGEVAVKEWYFDETNFGFGMGQAQVFSKEYYEILSNNNNGYKLRLKLCQAKVELS